MARKIKLFLVEDNDDERMFMVEGFQKSGLYEIIGEAENGDRMLEIFKVSSLIMPEVIISDLNMPGRNGYEVIMDVKTHSALSHIPIIIITTAPLIPFAERCKKLGACAYYTKPDIFLEYKEFSEKIYDDLIKCLDDGKLNCSSMQQSNKQFIYNILNSGLSVTSFFNRLRMLNLKGI